MDGNDSVCNDEAWTVTERYERSRENPVRGDQGDELQVGRSDDWAGHRWRWCTDSQGCQGWVADEVLDVRDGSGVLRRDFDATELTVAEGDRVFGTEVVAGWLWATTTGGESGWLPLEVVEER